jgi:hypothetical protein
MLDEEAEPTNQLVHVPRLSQDCKFRSTRSGLLFR